MNYTNKISYPQDNKYRGDNYDNVVIKIHFVTDDEDVSERIIECRRFVLSK